MSVNVIFVEPCFPANQRQFVRALHSVGARVIGVGERPKEALDDELKHWLFHYEQIGNVTSVQSLERVVRLIQQRVPVHRLEAVVEAHVMAAATVRERCGIAGTSVQTSFLCRDKPAMKDALRKAGVPTAESLGSDHVEEITDFAQRVGYPLIVKPRDGAGAAGASRVDDHHGLLTALQEFGIAQGRSVAIEEFIEGHEGFYDTLTIDGQITHEFISHYYPNVLHAMRTRWISPQIVVTNRIGASGYEELRTMAQRVIDTLGIETSATHMEWFYGPKGLKFSEIGCRPPGVNTWDLYSAANDYDLYRQWAMAHIHGRVDQQPSRRRSGGIIALRPERDGRILGYSGIDEMHHRYGQYIMDSHFPPPGSPARPVEGGYMANAWVRLLHEDYDGLRHTMDHIGSLVHVHAG
ncbi:MAG: ATP-grasp domain-containing protein [Myxococcota bacterium]|nr:ATP-grasp domain-containing protein [Myxococcota bacterium]